VAHLRLRALATGDESAVRLAHEQLVADHFTFALGYEAGMPWDEYLRRLEADRLGHALGEGRVPATFLLAEVDGRVVGRTSIRHELNAWLLRQGGHIGFAVVPSERRNGYATAILRSSLEIARTLGIDPVLVCCDEDNIGSATVITRCGGELESTVESSDGIPVQRYWIRSHP
jgi:predicted acetyltransferase